VGEQQATAVRQGRPPVTSRSELESVALDLFHARGFEATTVDDVAAAAGIGRRTFFRYYPSKNDVVWGDFEGGLGRLGARLAQVAEGAPVFAALRGEILAFNTIDPAEELRHRERMALILRVPALQAHSTLRYAAWRAVVAGYVGRRLALPADDLLPQSVAHAALGACLAGYERWLTHAGSDLTRLLDEALLGLERGYGALASTSPGGG
jgi:mycofactocin system transcriptional regulator